jgi:hypothetical protein
MNLYRFCEGEQLEGRNVRAGFASHFRLEVVGKGCANRSTNRLRGQQLVLMIAVL